MRQLIQNKKGAGPIGSIMLFGIFLIMYFVWIARWVSETGTRIVAENSMVGLEAFFWLNLNLWIMVFMVLGMLGWMMFGGQR